MSWLSLDVATGLVGFLAGLVFLLDGWKRNPKELLPFHKTPRITGIVWIISGGVISGFLTYFAKAEYGHAMILYVISFVSVLTVLLFLSAVAIAMYYVTKFRRQKSVRGALIEMIPISLSFLSNGLDAALARVGEEESRTAESKLQALEKSRLYLIQFVNDAENFVSRDVANARTGRNYFKYFLAHFLRMFVLMFFEEKDLLANFRAAFFEREEASLLFVEGADVKGSAYEFSRKPLDLQKSVAGRAFSDNRIIIYPGDSRAVYQTRSSDSPYKRLVVVPVPFKPDETDRIGVLCVDSIDPDAPFTHEFQQRLLTYFSNIIASARRSYSA